jgi:hypothetical protein
VLESQLPRPKNEQFGRLFKAKLKEVKAFFDAGGQDSITLGTDYPSWGNSGRASDRIGNYKRSFSPEFHPLPRSKSEPSIVHGP